MLTVCAASLVVSGALAAAGTAAAPTAGSPLTMQDRVLHAHDVGGFVPAGAVQNVITKASDWHAEISVPVAELRRTGFVRGIWEFLSWAARDRGAISAVAEFASPRAAQSEVATAISLARSTAAARKIAFRSFAVAGIPRAQAFRELPLGTVYVDVQFADGPYWYLVAESFPTAGGLTVSEEEAGGIAAARLLYLRVHGHTRG